jgi:hypothetical protein
MTDPTELDKLTKKCTDSLGHYIKEAQATCALLGSITRHPISEESRRELSIERSRENVAYAQYHEIRERLFKLAQWESE